METSYISTASLRNQARYQIQRLQSELSDRAQELATSRRADVGLELGTETSRMVALRNDADLLSALMSSNGTAAARLTLTQAALTDLRENASRILETLVAIPQGEQPAQLLNVEANSALDQLADRLNASDGGSFIFGGINSDTQPFNRFDDGPRTVVEAAFLTRFGVAVSSAGAGAITPADMADFLANDFADLFDDPQWGTDWSNASSSNITSRIAVSERVETGTNANETAVRNLTEGLAMLAGLGLESLSQETRDVVVEEARLRVGESINDFALLQGELGFSENAIEEADEQMLLSRNLISTIVADAEGADAAEAKVRVDLLTTQLEMSYALTGQLANLSILNYA